MAKTIQQLEEFLETANKNRKYAPNTVYGIKAALKLFSQELNEDEKQSLDLFRERFDSIYQSVFSKNKSKISLNSLETYKSRLQRFLRDYDKYGEDPTKMANWNVQTRIRPVSTKEKTSQAKANIRKPAEILETNSIDLDKGFKFIVPQKYMYYVARGKFAEVIDKLEEKIKEMDQVEGEVQPE